MTKPISHTEQGEGSLDFTPSRNATVGYILIAALLASYLICAAYEVEFLYFLVLLGIVVFVTGLINFEAAFLYIPLTLTNPYTLEETGTNLHLSEYVLLIIFGLWFLRMLFAREKFTYSKEFLVPSLVIIAIATASLLVARDLIAGVQQIVRYVEILLVFFFLVVNSCKDERRIKQIFLFLIIGGLAASLIGLGQFVTGTLTKGETRRIFGWHGGGYGALIASTLLFCLSALFERERKFKLWALITIPFASMALVLSQTRAWMAAFVTVVIAMLLLTRTKILGRLLLVFGLIILTIWVILETDLFGLVEKDLLRAAVDYAFRFGTIPGQRSLEDLSLFMRLNVWRHAINHFLSNPILGIGIGNLRFEDFFTGRLGKPAPGIGYVDNQYLQFFAEAGIVAGLAWMLYVYRALRMGARSLAQSAQTPLYAPAFGLYASLLIFAVGSLFWVITPHHELFALMILNIALLINIGRLASASIVTNT